LKQWVRDKATSDRRVQRQALVGFGHATGMWMQEANSAFAWSPNTNHSTGQW